MAETGKGGMPRIAEQFQWSPEASKNGRVDWGCWKCGNEDSRVRDTDKDDDGVRVRRRMCTRCGEMWETEERRIAAGSFFSRASTRRYAAYRKHRFQSRRCLVCDEHYLNGKYAAHANTSQRHLAAVAKIEKRKQDRERTYQREWTRARRALEKANRELERTDGS